MMSIAINAVHILSPNGVGGSANEASDAQILFQHLEEHLNRNNSE